MPLPIPTHDNFQQTRWSLIQELNADQMGSRSQLNELCLRYWTPIHQHMRRYGHDENAARTLTRDFFDHLQREGLSRADRYSRFREFLLEELEGFLARRRAQLESDSLPPLLPVEASMPVNDGDAGSDLQRNFALEVIAHSMARLRAEAADAGHLPMFERLQRYLSCEARPEDIERESAVMAAKPLFVSMAIRRLRQRFRRLVDDELTRLVTDPTDLVQEREAMMAALGRLP